jgi:hypothetical protein
MPTRHKRAVTTAKTIDHPKLFPVKVVTPSAQKYIITKERAPVSAPVIRYTRFILFLI